MWASVNPGLGRDAPVAGPRPLAVFLVFFPFHSGTVCDWNEAIISRSRSLSLESAWAPDLFDLPREWYRPPGCVICDMKKVGESRFKSAIYRDKISIISIP